MTRIIAFEGLSALLWPWAVPSHVKNGLLDPLALWEGTNDSRPNVSVWRGGFMSSGPNPYWIAGDKIIVVAHSMGGPTALWWCEEHGHENIDLLLTFDPRPLHRPYVKPANVKRAVNFYQRGLMRGYEVEGATNYDVTGWGGHTALPSHPKAREILLAAL